MLVDGEKPTFSRGKSQIKLFIAEVVPVQPKRVKPRGMFRLCELERRDVLLFLQFALSLQSKQAAVSRCLSR